MSRVKAVNYDIELFDLELGGAFSFRANVKNQVNIKSATKSIILNAHHLTIHEGEISGKCIKFDRSDRILRLIRSKGQRHLLR